MCLGGYVKLLVSAEVIAMVMMDSNPHRNSAERLRRKTFDLEQEHHESLGMDVELIDSHLVPTFVIDRSTVLDFYLRSAFHSDPDPVLGAALCPAFGSATDLNQARG
ncbi:hypothetical protein EVAR_32448_1 [Eumeta japonica]|uniref:Uncharacterized protein n=1 Tax=Eumeta variegata TaxID=151549 RepID=A0A4C1VNR3_EUMVA|nr:hypothetical protein EVAR_32448_1 [Eumeta japonica]